MALIPWWIKYPNVNDEIMNLDWLLNVTNDNTEKISNFINLNTIKYADPILWDITSQYEANTITVDPQTGDAYISTKAVPYGVALSNTDYWTKIYNYADEINGLEEQIAAANERLSTTATAPRAVGDLVWLNGLLYKITAPMISGDSYVVDSNCEKVTIEELLDLEATTLANQIQAEANTRAEADTTLDNQIQAEANTRAEADTTLDNQIQAEANTRAEADAKLANDIDDLSIFELPVYHGAVGDGVADDTQAIQSTVNAAISNGKTVLLNGSFKITGLTITGGVHIVGAHTQSNPSKATLVTSAPIQINYTQNPITISDVEIQNTSTSNVAIVNEATNVTIDRCRIASGNGAIINSGSLCKFTNNQIVANGGWAFIFQITNDRLSINNIVTNNIISGSANLMLVRSANNAIRPEGILFSNNDTMTTGNYGIMISAAYHVSIVNNTLDQIGRHVLTFNPTQDINSIIFSDNYVGIVDGSFYAIGGYLSNTPVIHNLIISDNNFYGASCIAYLNEYYQSVIINGNNFESSETGYAGINCRRVAFIRITNNRIFKTGNNATAINCDGQNISHMVLTGNIFVGLKTITNYDVNHIADSDNLQVG